MVTKAEKSLWNNKQSLLPAEERYGWDRAAEMAQYVTSLPSANNLVVTESYLNGLGGQYEVDEYTGTTNYNVGDLISFDKIKQLQI